MVSPERLHGTDGHARDKIRLRWGGAREAGGVMNGAKFIVSVGIYLGMAVAIACASSSNNPGPMPDGGSTPDASVMEASSVKPCDPFRAELCPQGQTCCSTGLRGVCTDVGACASPFQIGCVNTLTCPSGVCAAAR